MGGNDQERRAELIYLPEPSWAPAFTATGVALVVVGLFAGWVWAAAGAAFLLGGLGRWIGLIRNDAAHLPREQRPTTAVVPPIEAE